MKTFYISRSSNIVIDQENNSCNKLERCILGIDDIYLIKEPMHVVYGCGEKHHEADVEPNDIVITFYVDDFDTRMIVVKNEDWANNLATYEKKLQEEKERWAAERKNLDINCCDCESCKNDNQ